MTRPPRLPIVASHVLPSRDFMATVNSLIRSHSRMLAALSERTAATGPVEIEGQRLMVFEIAALDAFGSKEKGRAVTRPVVLT